MEMLNLKNYIQYFNSIGICSNFIGEALSYECSTLSVRKMPDMIKGFLNTDTVANHFIGTYEIIRRNNYNATMEDLVKQGITSDKLPNLELLYSHSTEFLKSTGSLYRNLLALALYQDTPAAINFLRKNMNTHEFMETIINRCGLSSNIDYYTQKDADIHFVENENLIAIFKKIIRIDREKALELLKTIFNIPSLRATAFINALFNLVDNNFVYDENIVFNNICGLDNIYEYGEIVVCSVISLTPQDYINDTQREKGWFYNSLPDDIKEDIKYDIELFLKEYNVKKGSQPQRKIN